MAAHSTFIGVFAFMFTALLLMETGCCAKHKCGTPPTVIRIRDSAGAGVAAAKVVGSGLEISACPAADDCNYSIRGGRGVVTVSAPGYKSTMVTIEPREDDCGNLVGEQIDVKLLPESGPDPSTASTIAGKSCGD